MKKCYISIIAVFLICVMLIFTACSDSDTSLSDIGKPNNLSTTDEVNPTHKASSIEESENVNGMHYTATLKEFTNKYNLIMMNVGGTDYLYIANWLKQGDVQSDSNGVEYQCYYYNCEKFNLTATVEVESEKIMNLGCGTTMNTFVGQEDGVNNSDTILQTCAIMAAAVCGFDESSLDLLQDIFYRTTFENADSLWYEDNIFSMSTQEDSGNSENNIMLFRIFPVTEELKDEWQIPDYEEYIASLTE